MEIMKRPVTTKAMSSTLLREVRHLLAEETGKSPGEFTNAQASECLALFLDGDEDSSLRNDCLHVLFEQQVERDPDALAIVAGTQQLTYGELNAQANRLAHYLLQRGVEKGLPVAVCMRRSAELVVALLAILKAGAAYLPIDHSESAPVIIKIIKRANPALLLTHANLLEGFDSAPACIAVDLDKESDEIDKQDTGNLSLQSSPDDPAYILDAFGKGVAVAHRKVSRRLRRMLKELGFSGTDVVLHKSPLDLNATVWEIFLPLLFGSRLIIAARDRPQDAGYLNGLIEEHGVSVLHFLPSELAAFLDEQEGEAPARLASLRSVLSSGEPLRRATVDKFFKRFDSSSRLYYSYAPPEAAADVTWHECGYGVEREVVALGQPHGSAVYLLDEDHQPVPEGVAGEICIAGSARGYLYAPEETSRRFVVNPFAAASGELLFKTGDMARRLSDGTIEMVGARGRFVWHRGFRVDLHKIEAALLDERSIEECVVVVKEVKDGGQELVACVVPSPQFVPGRARATLGNVLPCCMMPGAIITISSLPLTATGQVDEQALARLEVVDAELAERWESRLRELPEIEQVAVIIQKRVEQQTPLHLSEINPDWKKASKSAATTHVAQAGQALRRGEDEVKALALSEGGMPRVERDAPATLPQVLRRAALIAPDKSIICIQPDDSEVITTYPGLQEEAARILKGLRTLGLKPQDKVIFQLEKNQDLIAAFWGCVIGGFVPVPIGVPNAYVEADGTVNQLRNAWLMLDAPLVLTSAGLEKSVRSISDLFKLENFHVVTIEEVAASEAAYDWHTAQPDDLVLLSLTSGSTGMPKGVMLSHRNVIGNAVGMSQLNGFTGEDISLNWLPLTHVASFLVFHTAEVYLGCQQIQAYKEVVLQHPLKWLDWIDHYRATMTWGPNFAFALINDQAEEIGVRRWDLSSMRWVGSGAEVMVAQTMRRFLELLAPHGLPGVVMYPGYGMAETSSCITNNQSFSHETTMAADQFVDLGPPVPGVTLRIVDEENRVIDEGMIGSLQVRGETVTSGYYRNPQLNKEAFTADGWLITGDLGFLRDSCLTVTGREKETIIINGVNYYSHEIEAVVEEVERVEISYTAACAVRGPGSETDEMALFFNSTLAGESGLAEQLQEIRAQVVKRIGISPDYLIPIAKEAISKTSLGKIERLKLKRRFEAGEFDAILKRVDILSHNANTIPDWFYRAAWHRKEIRTHDAGPQSGLRLIFTDRLGLGAALSEKFGEQHQPCVRVEAGTEFARLAHDRYQIDASNPDHYSRLLRSLEEGGIPLSHVLHLWTYSALVEIESASALEQSQDEGLYSVLFLIQALAQKHKAENLIRFVVASSHAQPTSSADQIGFEKSPLLGLLRSASLEIPWLNCSHVDLALQSIEADASYIAQEMTSVWRDKEVAYRDGRRLVSRLEKVDMRRARRQKPPFKKGALYLLSGGLGGVGFQIARHLLHEYDARLLLVGRTRLPERSLWNDADALSDATTAERVRSYQALERIGGEFIYEAADVCDVEQLQRAVERATREWGVELDGIIHLAGVHHEYLLVEESRASLREILRPKLLGTLALHHIARKHSSDLFISFSSVNGLFGGFAAGAYAAANRFNDNFAHYQRHAHGMRSYSLAWSMWDETGMSQGYQMKDLSRARGFHSLSIEQGLRSFIAGLSRNQTHLLIGLDGSNQNIQKEVEGQAHATVSLSAFFTMRRSMESAVRWLKAVEVRDRFSIKSACEFLQVQEMPLKETGDIDREQLASAGMRTQRAIAERVMPSNETERKIAEIWEAVLGIAQVGIHDNFFEAGGASITAVQVISRVRDAFNIELPLSALFTGSATVAGLAQAVCNVGGAQLPETTSAAQLQTDATLDADIQPAGALREAVVTDPGNIFLTGVTGFVGGFLLSELLTQTRADVYCLVRSAPDVAEGRRRIEENLKKFSIWDEAFRSRIIPVCGDLSRPCLGLTEEQFGTLAEKIDVIYHCGAEVNFVLSYSALSVPNVGGTREIFRLAGRSRLKPVHYISTLSTTSVGKQTAREVFLEQEIDETITDTPLAYSLSKFIAEKLVEAAHDRGFPIAIYRPSTVMGHSQTGAANTKDFGHSLLKSTIMRGRMSISKNMYDMSPVDYVAKAITALSMKKESLGKVFHLNNPHPLSGEDFTTWLLSLGYQIVVVKNEAAPRAGKVNLLPSDPLYRFSSFFEKMNKLAGKVHELTEPEYKNTLSGLADTSIVCHPMNIAYLNTIHSYLISSGFLEPPQKVD